MSEITMGAVAQSGESILKGARVALGLSVEELSSRIKVREAYIRAVENHDWSNAPERVYLSGYIRQYAEAVGVDPEKALAEYLRSLPEEADPFASNEFEHIMAKEAEASSGRRQVPGVSGWVAAALPALFLAGYGLFTAMGPGAESRMISGYVTSGPASGYGSSAAVAAAPGPAEALPDPEQASARNFIVHSDGEAELRVYDRLHKQIESLKLAPNDVQFVSLPAGGYASASGFADGVTVYDEQMQRKIGNIRILLPKD